MPQMDVIIIEQKRKLDKERLENSVLAANAYKLLSIKENICPECHRKSYALQDAYFFSFLYTLIKRRSTAFQPCITLGGLHWTEMGQKNDFLKKNALKTAFWGDTILDRLAPEGAGTPIFKKNVTFSMFPFNFGP